ncbi:ubiquitin carboxyl-terminal hydrolase 31 isoform X1 [Hypanus sabinus]|uniref:ubiquitin carboxyl-terminal hydrolase 31 isoform X1 n=1 Tax=Hypanus sabinus TaxID=79690 RepID=UPI0028C482D0|nr:ubiquitin carboxyl-terminal hydrolase 31 isoform X1 [Hypanus sabinus]XP_059835695.1 ubiquitin carboxyl-terminal hydrolase 31 isoform X1 [Hypanus sabinus]
MSKSAAKEKKSFSKKLFRRGSTRSVGSFMSRVLKTLSTLSHFGTEESAEDDKDDGGFKSFRTAGAGAALGMGIGLGPGVGVVTSASSIIMMMSGVNHPAIAERSDSSDSCFSPASGDRWQPPGVSGLKNHGNTCFMNAVLQCLSNTELFAEFLALEQYRDLSVSGLDSPEAGDSRGQQREDEQLDQDKTSKSNGVLYRSKCQSDSRGEVTEQLASLVRALWTSEYTPQLSRDFKNVVSKNAFQYRGNSQHDAQEFLLWLLDRVHEDLNNIVLTNVRPPAKPPLNEDGMGEGPALPARSSFVQELFQAQYRSSLTCPHCQKQSNTFDPFLCISLPIPPLQTRPLNITVVYEGKCSHCMRIGVAVPLSGKVSKLREAVSQETKIPTDQIVLTDIYFDGFHRTFSDTDPLDTVHENDSIYAFETPDVYIGQKAMLTNINQNNLQFSTGHRSTMYPQGGMKQIKLEHVYSKGLGSEKSLLLVCNLCCTGQQGKRFGHPFVLYLDHKITWEGLQKAILEKMRHLFRPGMFTEVAPFSLRVLGGGVGKCYLSPQEDYPLCQLAAERAWKACRPGGPQHIKVIVEWDKDTKEYLFGNAEDEYVPDSESVRQQQQLHQQPQTYTLSQCFHLYTKEEQLAPDDAWRCPHCKQLQQGSIKLSLWTLPDVLIIHLKRFKQEGDKRTKLQNLVKFPLTGLDMTPHVVKRSQSSWSLPSHWSPWRRPYGLGRDPEDYLYDLYAVCNHHGTMQGGHYTAYCKNSVDGLWYCFDDSDVQQLLDEDVCKQTAYILFYQRRSTIPSWSANSSLAGSTSSSLCEHWINRLTGSKQPSVTSTASSRRTSLISLSESVEFTQDRSDQDDGGFSTRPFVRSVQRQSLSSRSSFASPLVLNENGVKSQRTLSSKLHMRSNSPSPFSFESPTHSPSPVPDILGCKSPNMGTPPLQGQGAISAGLPGRAPLAVMEGVVREDEMRVSGKAAGQRPLLALNKMLDQCGNDTGSLDKLTNLVDAVDKKSSSLGNPQSTNTNTASLVEEQKQRPSYVTGAVSAETPQKKSGSRVPSEQAKGSLTKAQSTLSSSLKNPQKAAITHEKIETRAATRRSTSSSVPRKEVDKNQQQTSSSPAQQKLKMPLASPRSSSPALKKVPGRSKTAESHSKRSPSPEKRRLASSKASSTSRLSHARSGNRPESRRLRNSSSSSSVTEAKSSDTSSRTDLRRDSSKSDDKGLSFFRAALRQKESRRSADLGKSNILAKKSADGPSKVASKKIPSEGPSKEGRRLVSEQLSSASSSASASALTLSSKVTSRGKSSSKDAAPSNCPLLPATKSKSSLADTGSQSPSNKKKPAEKTYKSRKIVTSSMQSSARHNKK